MEMKDGHCYDCGTTLTWDRMATARVRPTVCPLCSRKRNVIPIGLATNGRRAALSHEDARARWHGLLCAAVGLLDRIQRTMREHELTGEVHMGGIDEALDVVAEWAAGVRDA